MPTYVPVVESVISHTPRNEGQNLSRCKTQTSIRLEMKEAGSRFYKKHLCSEKIKLAVDFEK